MAFFLRLALLVSFLALPLFRCTSAASDTHIRSDDTTSLDLSRNFPRAHCPKAHIIGLRGNSTGPPQFGLLGTTITAIHHAIPHSAITAIKYPRESPYDYPSPEEIGRSHLKSKIKTFASKCPNTPIIIAGYSLGGIITLNTICSAYQGDPEPPLNPKYKHQIIAIVLYGEESRVPDQSYDRGTCTSGYGEAARNNANECQPYAPKIRSWCDYGDPLCCAGYNNPNRNVHKLYPQKYNHAAVKFVKQQYKKFRHHHHG